MIETDRLILRRWRAADLAPFAAINADPEVMRFFPDLLPDAQTETMVSRIQAHFAAHGFGFCAV